MKYYILTLLAVSNLAVAELDITSTQTAIPKSEPIVLTKSNNDSWVDTTHQDTQKFLSTTATKINNWFGKNDPNNPARASLRIIHDFHYNAYDGKTIKPKIRGRIRLPALENRLSVMIGADELDNKDAVGAYNENVEFGELRFDKKQNREDNASLALRFSKWQEKQGIDSDIDIGMRSGDEVYIRLRTQKQKNLSLFGDETINGRFEQIYRYGSKTEHYLRTNIELLKPYSATSDLNNHLYLDYSHNDNKEEINLGNNFYNAHRFDSNLGQKTLSYGIHINNRIDEKVWANSYGPFINYRQPIFKNWFFIQTEASYYNDKLKNKDHHLATFLRLEAVF